MMLFSLSKNTRKDRELEQRNYFFTHQLVQILVTGCDITAKMPFKRGLDSFPNVKPIIGY